MDASIVQKKAIAGFDHEIWLTVTEVSNLNDLNVATIRESCAKRHGKYRGGTYVFRKQGKLYEILLTSLPEAAQYKYWIEQKPRTSNLPATKRDNEIYPYSHETYNAIWENYGQKSDGIKKKAKRKTEILLKDRENIKKGHSKEQSLEQLNNEYGKISRSTLWRWEEAVEGHPIQYWEALLAPDYKGRSRTEIPDKQWDYFLSLYLDPAKPSATVCYRKTEKMSKEKGWGKPPSCKTFLRRIETDIHPNELTLGREGRTALKEKLWYVKRDYLSLRVHEVWESDARIFDVFVRLPDGTVYRPWVVMIWDVRTRKTLAVKIYITINVELVIDAYRSAVINTGTQPENFHLDNDTIYSNHAFTGGQKSPYRKAKPAHEQPVGILTNSGVNVIWATPYQGSSKGRERLWKNFADNVDKTFGKAYTGRNTVERPEDSDEKYAIPIDEFAISLINHIHEYENGELGKPRGHGLDKSVNETYDELDKECTKRPVSDEQIRAMRPYVYKRKLQKHNVFELKIPGYKSVEYEAGENLLVKQGHYYDIWPDVYNPKEPALVYQDRKYIGDAVYKDHVPYLGEEGKGANKRRNSEIKKRSKSIRERKQRVENDGYPIKINNQQIENSLLLSNIIKPFKKEKPSQEETIQNLDDGSILDTTTGEVFPRIDHSISTNQNSLEDQEELERKKQKIAEESYSDWRNRVNEKDHSGGNPNDPDIPSKNYFKE